MKIIKENKISIAERVKVLWNFDNEIHNKVITNVSDKSYNINDFSKRKSMKNNTNVTIIPIKPKNNK